MVVIDGSSMDFVECCGCFGYVYCECGCVELVSSLLEILVCEQIPVFQDLGLRESIDETH